MEEIINEYELEAKEKWGDTLAFKQSEERVKKMGKDGLKKILEKNKNLIEEISVCMKNCDDPKSEKVQKLIEKHYDSLKAFYDPTPEIYRGLAKMYVYDERFKENYESIAAGLSQFMHDAMLEFVREK